jgi:hypothetical protein
MIVSISKEDKTFYVHRNIIKDENTTMLEYIEKIKTNIQALYDSGYPVTAFNIPEVQLWDYVPKIKGKKAIKSNTVHQSRRGFNTNCLNLINLNQIKPLRTPNKVNKALIVTIDLETIELNNEIQNISILA